MGLSYTQEDYEALRHCSATTAWLFVSFLPREWCTGLILTEGDGEAVPQKAGLAHGNH